MGGVGELGFTPLYRLYWYVRRQRVCFIVWNFKLETLYSFVSYLMKAYKHCLKHWSDLGNCFRKHAAHPHPIFLEVPRLQGGGGDSAI